MNKNTITSTLKNNNGNKRRIFVTSLIVLISAFVYAIVRYNIIKGVSWGDLPLFISNKAIALAAVAFIAISYLIGPLSRFFPVVFRPLRSLRKYFGLAGFSLASVHAFMSLLLFTPAYYSKFFTADGKLNVVGELSMLFGVLAAVIFAVVAITSIPSVQKAMTQERWLAVQRLGYLAFFLVMLHVFVMGFKGWIVPAEWPGGLLPISLVAFIIIALALLARIIVIFVPKQ